MVVSETGRVNGSEQSPPATHPAVRLQAHRGHASRIPCRTASAILSARRMGATHQGGAGARPAYGTTWAHQVEHLPLCVGQGACDRFASVAYWAAPIRESRTPVCSDMYRSPRQMPGAFSCPAPSARGWARRAPPGRRDRDQSSLTAELVALRCRAAIF